MGVDAGILKPQVRLRVRLLGWLWPRRGQWGSESPPEEGLWWGEWVPLPRWGAARALQRRGLAVTRSPKELVGWIGRARRSFPRCSVLSGPDAVSMRMRVPSLALLSELRIWYCRGCGVGLSCSSDAALGSETSVCGRGSCKEKRSKRPKGNIGADRFSHLGVG